jgi:sugar (glycoside-pentoside-hexuronide) transporter
MLTKKEVFGHAAGGIGHNLIYALFSGFLLIFYTDIFGLSPAFTGVLFLIARVWDAVNDPMMGLLADRTHSRMGRYRVWLVRAAPVIAAALLLCFFVPDLPRAAQYVYCFATYILLGMSFTAADIPYWTLPSVMTDDPVQRNRVFSISSMACCLASGIGAVAAPILIGTTADKAAGYLLCAAVFGGIGIAGYLLCAALVREHLAPPPHTEALGASLRALGRNKPLLVLMAASLFGNLAFQLKIAANTYYGTYTLGDFGLITYLSAALLFGMLIGAALVPRLIRALGSKTAMQLVFAAGVAVSLAYWACGYASIPLVLAFSLLSAVVIGAFTVLVNAMTADAIDYSEYLCGQRNEGIITSTRTFITKLATAVAGTGVAFSLGFIGYVPNAAQTEAVRGAFQNMMSLIPAVLYAAGWLTLLLYPLSRAAYARLQQDLRQRRENAHA